MLRPTVVNAGGRHSSASGVSAVNVTTLFGVPGSLLASVSVADFGPDVVGAKRTCTSSAAPGAMTSGNTSTCGTSSSGELDVMLAIDSGDVPLLLIVSGVSLVVPAHTVPKFPVSATLVTM